MLENLSLARNIFISSFLNRIVKINFAITNLCNARCKTCNIWKKCSTEELELDEILSIFNRFPKTVGWLSLTGGEPFLRKDIRDILLSAKDIKSLKLLTLPTNGILKNKICSVIEEYSETIHPNTFITISLDGIESVHDNIRGVNGAYEKAMGTFLELNEMGDKKLNILIETTLSQFNIEKSKTFISELIDKGHKVGINIAHNSDFYNINSLDKIKIEDTNDITKLIIRNQSIFSINAIVQRFYMQKIGSYLENPDKRVIPCSALKVSCGIDPYGNVTPCSMWKKNIGNLRDYDYDISKIYNLDEVRFLRHKIHVKKECPNCWTPCEAYQSILLSILNFRYFIN